MIPLEKLKSLTHCVTHANCPDGVASALVLKDALPDLDVRFVKYDTEEHKNIEIAPNTIFCDFSPWLPKLKENPERRLELIKSWNDAGVIVLDHHSCDIVEPYTYVVFGENDKLECGAALAFEHVWVPLNPNASHDRTTDVEMFAHLAAIRDTWKRDHELFETACRQAAVLQFFRLDQLTIPMAEEMQETLAPRLFERQIELAESCIKEAFLFMSDKGTRVLMFQGVSATSDAAELLDVPHYFNDPPNEEGKTNCKWCGALNTRPSEVSSECRSPNLIVGFHYRVDGGVLKLQFSTRSHTGYDCQALAQANGGNGHKAAAGFTVAVDSPGSPYDTFEDILEDWEGGA